MEHKTELLIDETVQQLLNEPIFVEYFSLLDQINNNLEIQNLVKELNVVKQQMTKSLKKETEHSKLKQEYTFLTKRYLSYPLIHNFLQVEKEVFQILEMIKRGVEQ